MYYVCGLLYNEFGVPDVAFVLYANFFPYFLPNSQTMWRPDENLINCWFPYAPIICVDFLSNCND